MNHLLLWIFIVIILDRVQFSLTANSYNNPYCTFGAIDGINARNIKAPMAYRVLVPAWIEMLEFILPNIYKYRVTVYELIKIAVMVYAFLMVDYALGLERALLVTALVPITFMFDYVDCYFELAAYAAALSGNANYTLIACGLLAFERETAPLVPLTYLLVTGNVVNALTIGLNVLLIMASVRLLIGYRPLYCDRVMIKRNWKELKESFSLKFAPAFFSYQTSALLLCLTTIGAIIATPSLAARPIPILIIYAGYIFGVASEICIFMPVLLWLAMAMIR